MMDTTHLKVYLGGQMTGVPDHNRAMFSYVAERLRSYGIDVLSPSEFMHGGDTHVNLSFDHSDYLRADIENGLRHCNAICLLPGWTNSRGARDEFNYAAATGRRIFYWEPDEERMIRMDLWRGPVTGNVRPLSGPVAMTPTLPRRKIPSPGPS